MRIGEVARLSGVSRKALRLYEAAGILDPPRRTAAGYRVYGDDVLALLAFVAQARRLGFSLAELKDVLAIKRSGRRPCRHVLSVIRRKASALDETLRDLTAMRRRLGAILASADRAPDDPTIVCHHIESSAKAEGRRKPDGIPEVLALPRVRRLPGGRDLRRRSPDR
jgi:MerR family transcriptional regulator, copper efflux regulator